MVNEFISLRRSGGGAGIESGANHYPRVIFHRMAMTRRSSATDASACCAGRCPHATATRNAVSVSFALPAALNSRALAIPGIR